MWWIADAEDGDCHRCTASCVATLIRGWRLGNVPADGNEGCFRAISREPGNRGEWVGENRALGAVVQPLDDPILAGASNSINKGWLRHLASRLVKHHGYARTLAAKNSKHKKHPKRKSTLRPSQRRELQQNPVSPPGGRFAPQLPKRAQPAKIAPVHAHLLQLHSSP